MDKKIARLRRARKTRFHIRKLNTNRLSVHKTPQHIYASIFTPCGSQVLVTASTLDKEVRGSLAHSGNIEAAKVVGALLAKRAKEKGITEIAFDKSGYKYHGRVKALADAARETGMVF